MHLQKIGSCSSWGVLRSHSLFARGSHCPFPLKILVSLIIFETLFYVAATTKNIFCVNNGVKLAHISVAPKFYNSLIPLRSDHAFPQKYFGKLLHIYQIIIVRLHL